MFNMSNEQYARYIDSVSPRSKSLRNMLRAFFTGGAVCCVGQALLMLFLRLGLDEEDAFGAVSATLVFLGALLTAVGVYDRMAKFCGAGTLVPITGFANSVAAPAIEFRAEGFVTGTAVKMFTIAGPVIVFGTAASVLYGVVLLIADIFS